MAPLLPSQQNRPYRSQSGYILILSALFLFVLMAGSAHFFYRTTENTNASGTTRDSIQALLLAESVLELMRGQLVLNRLDSDNNVRVTACQDPNNNNLSSDICEAAEIRSHISDPLNHLFPYMYFVSATDALENSTPQLLQRIANGETQQTNPSALNSQKIAASTLQLRINDLFDTNFAPHLFVLNANGRPVPSAAADWDAETSALKAAAWVEVIINPNSSESVDLIVQAVAQVDKARSYVQRYAGTFSSSTSLGSVSMLSEASNINRGS